MRKLLKIFSLVLGVAVLLLGAYLGYRYLVSPQTQPIGAATPSTPATNPATAATPALKPFTTAEIFDYWLNTKTGAIYYAAPDGKVFRTFGDGRDQNVSEQTLAGLNAITPSPDGTRAIARFGYPSQDIFAVFDTELKSWERLPDGAVMAAFDPSGSKIAYIAVANNVFRLYTLDIASKKAVEIAKFTALDGNLLWPKTNEVYIVSRPSEAIGVQSVAFDLVKKTFRFVNKNNGGELRWSPDGTLGLKTQLTRGGNPQIMQMNDAGAELGALPIPTIASKCSFKGKLVYCATPTPTPTDRQFFEQWLKEARYSTDSIISYDTQTGDLQTLLGGISEQIDAVNLVVRNKQLLFLNRYDKKIYALDLPKEA